MREEEESYTHRHVTCLLRNRAALLCLSTADSIFLDIYLKYFFRILFLLADIKARQNADFTLYNGISKLRYVVRY